MGTSHEYLDPSARAAHGLDSALATGTLVTDEVAVVSADLQQIHDTHIAEEHLVTAAEALDEAPILASTERKKIRVLFISDDDALFIDGSTAQQHMAEHGELFEEVHVIVCTTLVYEFGGIKLRDNVWVYPSYSESTLMFMYDAYRTADRELYFANTFRPDVIGASNPFLVGCVAFLLARMFKRGLYIEIPTYSLEKKLSVLSRRDAWRQHVARFLMRRADRIRVCTTKDKNTIEAVAPKVSEKVALLPFFADIHALKEAVPEWTLHDRYPQFSFVIVLIAKFIPESNILLAIEACQFVLRQYPTVGMVIVGDGPERGAIISRITAKQLETKIFITKPEASLTPYFKTAQMLISPAIDGGDISVLVSAAASRLPIVATKAGAAAELLEHEKSGLVCEPGDLGCFVRSVNAFLSNNSLRNLCVANAESRVASLTDNNGSMYHELVRENIERAMVAYEIRTGDMASAALVPSQATAS